MKKVIFYILGIIVLLVAGFFSIGFVIPAVEYTTTIEIDKPRDFTWNVIRERKDWIYGFKSYEQVSGQPNAVGSRAKITVVRDGREMSFESELLDIKPPEMSVTELTNNMLTHDATVHLTENNGKTTIVSNEKITGRNAFFRSLFVLFRGSITSVSQKNFEGLKQAVESSN
jgi:carbon monoxide dehydrogenase subunit G